LCQIAVDKCWRIILGFGCVPACFALYFRLTIPETPRFTLDVSRDVERADEDFQSYVSGSSRQSPNVLRRAKLREDHAHRLTQPRGSWQDFIMYFGKWKHGKVLLGTTLSWFLLDMAFYGLGLNNSTIMQAIGYANQQNVFLSLYNSAVGNIILVCAGAIPGYWLTVALIDKLGRIRIQVGGFAILTVIFCIIGFAYQYLTSSALLSLYVLAQLFFNFGE
jgi:PHS family inorganic phosphate transporter-like MFS transporter